MGPTPDTVLNETDPGDDVQRRFGFQATKAAMLSLSMLDSDAEVLEVYCEHHEDILIKKLGDRFIGYQVKTKLDEAGPHKATDEEIVRSIRRFIDLEHTFGQHFDRYTIGSNAGFWNEDRTGSSLPHILSVVAKAADRAFPTVAIDYLKKVYQKPAKPRKRKIPTASNDGQAPMPDPQTEYKRQLKEWEERIEHGKKVLKKLSLDTLPSLKDMRAALIDMLPRFEEIGDRLHSELGALADGVVDEMLRAARLDQHSVRNRYLAVFNDPAAIEASEIIKGKRITKERLVLILRSVLPIQPTLCTNQPLSAADLPSTSGNIDAKMTTGGISINNVNLAKDLKSSTELILARWLHSEGKARTDARYQHLRTLVLNECQEAFDKAKGTTEVFGQKMLDDIRTRLRERFKEDKANLFGCSYEHLLGMASILTEDCPVWWSEPFVLPKSGGAK